MVNTIKTQLEEITNFTIEELLREEELGTQFSFKDIEATIINTVELSRKLKEVQLDNVPAGILNNLNSQQQAILSHFKGVVEFNATMGNAPRIRQNLINQITSQYDAYYQQAIPVLTIGLLNSNDLSLERSKMKALVEELENDKKNAEELSKSKLNELNLILENAKSFATKAGVSKHSNTFHDEFIEHEKEAKKWLKYSTIILIAITAIAIVFLYVGSYFSKSSEIIQLAITKVIVLSTLFYGLGITNRNYRAHKHNSVMNKHRQNALITFETFSNASSADNQTKNAVLLEATHTIFSTHQTGYLKTENESESNNKIVEIIKSAATKAD